GRRPQIARARATKSGRPPTGRGAAGTSRATTRFRRVISTTSPRLTERRILGRLCWASRTVAVRMCVSMTHGGTVDNGSVQHGPPTCSRDVIHRRGNRGHSPGGRVQACVAQVPERARLQLHVHGMRRLRRGPEGLALLDAYREEPGYALIARVLPGVV